MGADNDQGLLAVGLDVRDKHVHACFLAHHGDAVIVLW